MAEILSIWRKTPQKINQTINLETKHACVHLCNKPSLLDEIPKIQKKIPQNNNNNKEVEEPVDSRRYIKNPTLYSQL